MKLKILDAAKRSLTLALAALFVFTMTPQLARGQDYPDAADDDVDQIVARVSFLQGPVSYARGDDPDDWDPAVVNIPFALGDKLYSSADGRAELSLPGGSFVRIGRRSYLSALTLSYDTKQFYVGNGAAAFTVRQLGRDEIFEIDTPSVAITVDQPGRYRVEVDDNGDTRVIVSRGIAFVAANGRQVTVERAEMDIYGLDAAEYEIVGLRQPDTFDRWVDERQARFDARFREAYQYADEEIVGMEDLAGNGRWEDIPEYGRAWTPTVVAVGWQPFTVGHFFWQDPWGWSWISEEPWGWAPSHYGRWTFYRDRWYWVPGRRGAVVVRYAPAVVEFVPVRGYIGWFPLHPRDRFVPWWGRRERVVENVTFVNRTRVVLVNEQTFISSRRVTTNIIRDTTIIREATTVRLSERRLPVPQRESIHVVSERRQVERPPANIVARPVVVRTAPTPPPPRFDEKVSMIRQRQGQPLTTREIVDMGAKDFKSNRRIQIRTATETKGKFTARGGEQGAKAVQSQPIAPLKGRNLATTDNPVQTDLPRRQQREQQREDRQGQQQQQKTQEQQRDLQKQQQEQKQPRDQDQLQKKQERDQDQLQKKQEREREKDQKQLQDQQRKDQELQKKDLERKQQEQDRLQKQQQRDQDQLQKKQDRDLKEQEKKSQQFDRKDQQQQDDLRRKQLQDDQQKQRQLQQDQQRQQQPLQQDQKKQEQDQRRQELERQRLEKQQQDKQGRDLDRDRQEQLRQKKPDEQQRKGPPPDDRTPPRTKERKDQDAPPPPPPGPPPGPPPR